MGLNAGVITLRKLRASIYFCYLAALTFGILLTRIGGLPIILIGATSILASLAYSTKPYPLGDHALGEPLFFIFFGPVSLIGCYFVQALAAGTPFNMTLPITLCAISIGALITNILVIDNIRDLDFDRAKNEITIAVLIGRKWSFAEYILLTASAYVIPFLLWVVEGFNVFILLTYLSLPYAFTVTQRLLRSKTFEDRIPLTPQAGQVLLLYSFLLTLGICLR
jgi:1,4-dihydroxy-2-naphthoate octaprenyltransferase